MRTGRSILALVLLASMGGCYYGSHYPSAGAWNAGAIERPQRVRFFYGYVVDVRAVPVIYEPRARFEPNWEPEGRDLVPVVQQYPAPDPSPRPPGYEDPCPGRVCQGVEYTVMLDKPTMPADEFLGAGQHPAIVVVQNIAETERPMPKGTRVVVRMMNNSAEVMAASVLPRYVGGTNVENALSDPPPIDVESALSAGPMPIPLWYREPLPAPEILLPPCGQDRPCLGVNTDAGGGAY